MMLLRRIAGARFGPYRKVRCGRFIDQHDLRSGDRHSLLVVNGPGKSRRVFAKQQGLREQKYDRYGQREGGKSAQNTPSRVIDDITNAQEVRKENLPIYRPA